MRPNRPWIVEDHSVLRGHSKTIVMAITAQLRGICDTAIMQSDLPNNPLFLLYENYELGGPKTSVNIRIHVMMLNMMQMLWLEQMSRVAEI